MSRSTAKASSVCAAKAASERACATSVCAPIESDCCSSDVGPVAEPPRSLFGGQTLTNDASERKCFKPGAGRAERRGAGEAGGSHTNVAGRAGQTKRSCIPATAMHFQRTSLEEPLSRDPVALQVSRSTTAAASQQQQQRGSKAPATAKALQTCSCI